MAVAFALASFRICALFSLRFDHGEVLEEVIRIPQARAEQQAQAQALLEIAYVCMCVLYLHNAYCLFVFVFAFISTFHFTIVA